MVLWRYNHDGKVCSGDFLTQAEKNNKDISKHYLIEKGWFIEVTLKVIFACVLLVCLSIMLVAICFSTGGIKRKNSTFIDHNKTKNFNEMGNDRQLLGEDRK